MKFADTCPWCPYIFTTTLFRRRRRRRKKKKKVRRTVEEQEEVHWSLYFGFFCERGCVDSSFHSFHMKFLKVSPHSHRSLASFQVWLGSIKNATSASSSPQASKCPPPIQAQQDEKTNTDKLRNQLVQSAQSNGLKKNGRRTLQL